VVRSCVREGSPPTHTISQKVGRLRLCDHYVTWLSQPPCHVVSRRSLRSTERVGRLSFDYYFFLIITTKLPNGDKHDGVIEQDFSQDLLASIAGTWRAFLLHLLLRERLVQRLFGDSRRFIWRSQCSTTYRRELFFHHISHHIYDSIVYCRYSWDKCNDNSRVHNSLWKKNTLKYFKCKVKENFDKNKTIFKTTEWLSFPLCYLLDRICIVLENVAKGKLLTVIFWME